MLVNFAFALFHGKLAFSEIPQSRELQREMALSWYYRCTVLL